MRYFLLFICFFLPPAFANQLIIEPEEGRQPILNIIHEAKQSVDLVMYGFTDPTLLQAFIDQQKAGRDVKIILEEKPYKADDENTRTIAAFNQNHLAWHGRIPPYRLIHQKTLIADQQKAMVMTFNFTRSTFKNERNFGLLIDDPAQVKIISNLFAADWNASEHPQTSLANITGTAQQQGILISPETSRPMMSSFITTAHHSINIYAQNVNDYKLVGAFAKAARGGVQVRILTSSTMRQKQADYLAKAGVIVRYSKKLIIHAKVIMLDDTQAILGSINLTRASLDDNRELALVTHDNTIIRQLATTFENDWQAANAASITANTTSHHSNSLTQSEKNKQKAIKLALHTLERMLNTY